MSTLSLNAPVLTESKTIIQSGVVPYRFNDKGGVEVLLITTRGRQNWIVPKGHVESGMTQPESAAKEAFEEAGVFGLTLPLCVGSYLYTKKRTSHRVRLFPMRITRQFASWPEKHQRQRIWATPLRASCLVENAGLAQCLEHFEAFVMCRGRSRAVA